MGVADFVLQKFKPNEEEMLREKEEEIFSVIRAFLAK
jgi:peptidyl-tRNA hydrolase